eukprot:5710131-Alexandrium_andersonii.AAC.1
MSASLVGSEMCIRDRTRGSSWEQPRLDPVGSWAAAAARRDAAEAGPRSSCLLYTSDAADDM